MKDITIQLHKTNPDRQISRVHLRGNGQRNDVLNLLMEGTYTYLSSEFPSVDPLLAIRIYCSALERLAVLNREAVPYNEAV